MNAAPAFVAPRQDHGAPPDAHSVITALGGCGVIARICDCGLSTVHMWSQNGIPLRRALQLRDYARQRQIPVSLDDLVDAFPPRPKRPAYLSIVSRGTSIRG